MPKLKSHRGASKRFKITKSGKVLHASQNRRHILTKKAAKRKRQIRRKQRLSVADEKRIRDLLPY
jgi:large subunit ribosomal protein L35